MSVRVAAVADIHFGRDSRGTLAPYWGRIHEQADLFLLGGDLTRVGDPAEAQVLAEELAVVRVPIFAVLGNHDYHSDQSARVIDILRDARVQMVEGTSTVITVGNQRVGIAGTKGFGGGFVGACATAFGEPETKAYVHYTMALAARLEESLRELETTSDYRIALLHYAPIDGTIEGEKRQIYPFLGSYLLAESIDRVGADIVFHGHAHLGREKGVTPGGIPVRNVAQPVLRHAYNVYCLDHARASASSPSTAATASDSPDVDRC